MTAAPGSQQRGGVGEMPRVWMSRVCIFGVRIVWQNKRTQNILGQQLESVSRMMYQLSNEPDPTTPKTASCRLFSDWNEAEEWVRCSP